MNILISGDFYISDVYQNKNLIDKSVIDLFQQADYRMVNLEAPITANEPKNKILKTGPHLRMSEHTVMPYLKQLKVDAVKLANNHILDYGEKGLYETFESLKQNKIDYVGAGNNLSEAAQPLTLEKDGLRIAILNFCENEWSIAEADKPGANPMDIIDNTNQIKEAKATHDKVICIIHGGHEYYHLPSPRMQKQYRFYVDNGADAIVGHHTHCIGGYEIYNEVPIIYSLGNFLFTKQSKYDIWYKGLTICLSVDKSFPIEFTINSIHQNREDFYITNYPITKDHNIIQKLNEINKKIEDNNTIIEEWNIWNENNKIKYLNFFLCTNAFSNNLLRRFLYRIGFGNLFLTKHYFKLILNIIRCEAHLDSIKQIIYNRISIKQ